MQSIIKPRAARLEAALTTAFAPALLHVHDDSARHAGHAGAQPGGETHYNVLLVSEAFAGMPRVARSRAVHQVLAGEFASGLHALALTLRTPQEQAQVVAKSQAAEEASCGCQGR